MLCGCTDTASGTIPANQEDCRRLAETVLHTCCTYMHTCVNVLSGENAGHTQCKKVGSTPTLQAAGLYTDEALDKHPSQDPPDTEHKALIPMASNTHTEANVRLKGVASGIAHTAVNTHMKLTRVVPPEHTTSGPRSVIGGLIPEVEYRESHRRSFSAGPYITLNNADGQTLHLPSGILAEPTTVHLNRPSQRKIIPKEAFSSRRLSVPTTESQLSRRSGSITSRASDSATSDETHPKSLETQMKSLYSSVKAAEGRHKPLEAPKSLGTQYSLQSQKSVESQKSLQSQMSLESQIIAEATHVQCRRGSRRLSFHASESGQAKGALNMPVQHQPKPNIYGTNPTFTGNTQSVIINLPRDEMARGTSPDGGSRNYHRSKAKTHYPRKLKGRSSRSPSRERLSREQSKDSSIDEDGGIGRSISREQSKDGSFDDDLSSHGRPTSRGQCKDSSFDYERIMSRQQSKESSFYSERSFSQQQSKESSFDFDQSMPRQQSKESSSFDYTYASRQSKESSFDDEGIRSESLSESGAGAGAVRQALEPILGEEAESSVGLSISEEAGSETDVKVAFPQEGDTTDSEMGAVGGDSEYQDFMGDFDKAILDVQQYIGVHNVWTESV